MTAATLVENKTCYQPGHKYGSATIGNGTTSKFGLAAVEGIVFTPSTDNDVIISATISGGTVTISVVDDAGSAVHTGFTAYYHAWGRQ
jgi:hypothetical protein